MARLRSGDVVWRFYVITLNSINLTVKLTLAVEQGSESRGKHPLEEG